MKEREIIIIDEVQKDSLKLYVVEIKNALHEELGCYITSDIEKIKTLSICELVEHRILYVVTNNDYYFDDEVNAFIIIKNNIILTRQKVSNKIFRKCATTESDEFIKLLTKCYNANNIKNLDVIIRYVENVINVIKVSALEHIRALHVRSDDDYIILEKEIVKEKGFDLEFRLLDSEVISF